MIKYKNEQNLFLENSKLLKNTRTLRERRINFQSSCWTAMLEHKSNKIKNSVRGDNFSPKKVLKNSARDEASLKQNLRNTCSPSMAMYFNPLIISLLRLTIALIMRFFTFIFFSPRVTATFDWKLPSLWYFSFPRREPCSKSYREILKWCFFWFCTTYNYFVEIEI